MNARKYFMLDQVPGVSKFRYYLLKFYYLLIFLALGIQAWSEIITHKGLWLPLPGVAYGFWAAFATLLILGLLHPLKMIPLLLLQFFYKLIWLIIVAYPLWSANQLTGSDELTNIMFKGVIVDLLVLPWIYVFKNYIFLAKKNK
jgi:hypothetical protein